MSVLTVYLWALAFLYAFWMGAALVLERVLG